MPEHPTSWLGYINTLKQVNYTPEQLATEGLERILNINTVTQSAFSHSIPWIYLLDYTTGKYLLVSKSMKLMLGYSPDVFMNEGLNLTLENYHADHMRLFNNELFPDRLALLKTIPFHEHPNHVFTYNFRFRTSEGDFINLLQRNCFVKSDSNGNPLLSFGVITNVNHYVSENPIIQMVERIHGNSNLGHSEMLFKKSYYLHEEYRLFTKREREIVKWMADGLTSKEIANRLFISENTVINHRRNMMQKSNACNAMELVSFSIRNHII